MAYFFRVFLVGVSTVLLQSAALADPSITANIFTTPVFASTYLNDDNAAFAGLDPVATAKAKKAVFGSPEFTIKETKVGVTLYFISAANRDSYLQHPERTEFFVGGMCSMGFAAPGHPHASPVDLSSMTFETIENGADTKVVIYNHTDEAKRKLFYSNFESNRERSKRMAETSYSIRMPLLGAVQPPKQ